jgi:hypothetical protein
MSRHYKTGLRGRARPDVVENSESGGIGKKDVDGRNKCGHDEGLLGWRPFPSAVMPGLIPGIHDFGPTGKK